MIVSYGFWVFELILKASVLEWNLNWVAEVGLAMHLFVQKDFLSLPQRGPLTMLSVCKSLQFSLMIFLISGVNNDFNILYEGFNYFTMLIFCMHFLSHICLNVLSMPLSLFCPLTSCPFLSAPIALQILRIANSCYGGKSS